MRQQHKESLNTPGTPPFPTVKRLLAQDNSRTATENSRNLEAFGGRNPLGRGDRKPANQTTGKSKLPAPALHSTGVPWLIHIRHVFAFDQANRLDRHGPLADSALGREGAEPAGLNPRLHADLMDTLRDIDGHETEGRSLQRLAETQ